MVREDFEHKPLDNLIRGLSMDEREPTPDELRIALKQQGINVDDVTSQIESQVSALVQRERNTRKTASHRRWNNQSVILFAQGEDPIAKMVSVASSIALRALEGASSLGPIDPFRLAELRRIPVIPNEAITDARLIPLPNDRYQIEFNPNQPRSRTRFSIAHELAHTFFENCGEAIRNRQARSNYSSDDWELEMLCNIGAAELLMPIASFPELRSQQLGIARLMELKEELEVSAEALLVRVARIAEEPCAMFAASRIEAGNLSGRYRIDYITQSRSWRHVGPVIGLLPPNTVASECTAIGFTALGDEKWDIVGSVHVECVGVWPYRGARFPRVIGIVRSSAETPQAGLRVVYVKGDATKPRGTGSRVLAHNINDKALSWGFGFAGAVAAKWPEAEREFRQRVFKDKSTLRLGNTFHTEVEPQLWTFQMVCQHGYGSKGAARIRYSDLKSCLDELAAFALQRNATVHMPRLGTGYGGARWEVVAEIVDETLCAAGVPVTVYDLPGAKIQETSEQPDLFSR